MQNHCTTGSVTIEVIATHAGVISRDKAGSCTNMLVTSTSALLEASLDWFDERIRQERQADEVLRADARTSQLENAPFQLAGAALLPFEAAAGLSVRTQSTHVQDSSY